MKFLKITLLVAIFIAAGAIFTHSLSSINQDIGRHLKTGQIIWDTHSIPKTNLFSYTEPETHFINHHWLSEVVFYLLNIYIGLKGLILFKVGVLLLALWLLWRGVSNKVEALPFTVATLLGLLVILDRTDVRPEIFSYLFLAYFLFAILKSKYSQTSKWLYALPVAQIFWTNMHIYFILGPALIGLYALERWANKESDWSFVAKITGLSLVATLINPNGIFGALAPLTIFNNYGYSIAENQSVLFLKNYGILLTQINIFILTLVLFWLSYIPTIKKIGTRGYIFEIGTGLAFSVLGFDMIRNFGPYAIILIPILALNIQAWLSPVFSKPKILNFFYALLILICILVINSVVHSNFYRWADSRENFGLSISTSAEGGVNFVKKNKIFGPVFNNFDVGSYLIWKLYPDQKVFVDGRPEAYTPKFFSDIYKPMQENPDIWNYYANDIYRINYIFFDYHDITPWAQTFLSFISQDKNWPLIYQDDSVAIFIRNSKENSPIINKYKKTPNQ